MSTAALTQPHGSQSLENCPWGALNFAYRSQTKSSVPYTTHSKDGQTLPLLSEGEREEQGSREDPLLAYTANSGSTNSPGLQSSPEAVQ